VREAARSLAGLRPTRAEKDALRASGGSEAASTSSSWWMPPCRASLSPH